MFATSFNDCLLVSSDWRWWKWWLRFTHFQRKLGSVFYRRRIELGSKASRILCLKLFSILKNLETVYLRWVDRKLFKNLREKYTSWKEIVVNASFFLFIILFVHLSNPINCYLTFSACISLHESSMACELMLWTAVLTSRTVTNSLEFWGKLSFRIFDAMCPYWSAGYASKFLNNQFCEKISKAVNVSLDLDSISSFHFYLIAAQAGCVICLWLVEAYAIGTLATCMSAVFFQLFLGISLKLDWEKLLNRL